MGNIPSYFVSSYSEFLATFFSKLWRSLLFAFLQDRRQNSRISKENKQALKAVWDMIYRVKTLVLAVDRMHFV